MNRFYRSWHSKRFKSFTVVYRESDLWIGVDVYDESMKNGVYQSLIEIHSQIRECISRYPKFLVSFKPVDISSESGVIKRMLSASKLAGVGPMASIAGAIADEIGDLLIERYGCKEVLIENGGDIFVKNIEPVVVSVYAGNSVLSGKIGLEIPPGRWGICTSSGTVGHSISFGNADAVTVVSETAAVADAFATSYCNRVKKEEDIGNLLNKALNEYVLTVLVIYGDKFGLIGKHELRLIEREKDGVHESD